MAFDFNFGLLKEHPYATGGIVIVGGVIVFYLLSSRGTSGTGASSSDFQSQLAADAQLQQVQAQENIASTNANAQLQQAQLAANVSNTQTAASVATNNTLTAAQLAGTLAGIQGTVQTTAIQANAATAQQYNAAISTQNEVSMQDAVLQSQINSGVVENANNNATALAGLESNNAVTYGLGSQTIGAGLTLAQQQQQNFETNVQAIAPLAGQQKNSALDATNQTAIFQTILSNGNPGVAASGNGATSTAAVSGNNAGASIINGVTSTIGSVAKGLLG